MTIIGNTLREIYNQIRTYSSHSSQNQRHPDKHPTKHSQQPYRGPILQRFNHELGPEGETLVPEPQDSTRQDKKGIDLIA